MKLNVVELRDLVAGVVKETLAEAGKKRPPKEVPMKTPESELEQRDRHVRGMPGYAHSEANDFSKPLGPANLAKRQGASNMGGWTSESAVARVQQKIRELQIRHLVRTIVAEEVALLREETPPGFEKVVKGLKRSKGVKNPWAVAWSMKNKGTKPK